MKYALLAAVALIATPALAQTTPPQPPIQDQAAPATMAEPAPPAPAPETTTVQSGTAVSEGGYQPAMTSTAPVPPGAAVRYVPAPTVEQAYPAPAPMAKYPICKRGQTDHCMQRGG